MSPKVARTLSEAMKGDDRDMRNYLAQKFSIVRINHPDSDKALEELWGLLTGEQGFKKEDDA
jgi:hypothetical protein